ncbi:MAG TPA: hypothetical protein VLA48_02055 [Nitrososphaeraceae archaeon]|nr:hypothetical protein [Nitrososphaeraceae archaeon]
MTKYSFNVIMECPACNDFTDVCTMFLQDDKNKEYEICMKCKTMFGPIVHGPPMTMDEMLEYIRKDDERELEELR